MWLIDAIEVSLKLTKVSVLEFAAVPGEFRVSLIVSVLPSILNV